MYSVWDIISMSEIILIISPIYFYIKSHNIIHVAALIGLIATLIATEGIKQYMLPSWKRPSGAKGCDLLCKSPSDEGRPGMPSGHMAVTAFYGAFYKITSPFYYIYAILIALSRYYKRCHSIAQIIGGTIFGASCGYAIHLV